MTMLLKKWDNLPKKMRNDKVKPYYGILTKHKGSLIIKRIFDFSASLVLLVVLSPALGIIALWIKQDSKGPILFKQTRITQYGKPFKIYKFRTMIENAEQLGSKVTVNHDSRVTKAGHFLRKYRLDEIPQLLNILKGEMSFVGPRPEVPKYVNQYTDEMMATLLLPAGVTSKASICFKDEEKMLSNTSDVDEKYIEQVLPLKMLNNLEAQKHFSFIGDLFLMLKTVSEVLE